MNGKSGKQIRWIDFIHWYSHLPETPASPIGEASFSIDGLIMLTGMGRCWLLKFVTRYGVRSYSVGWLKRYIFRESQQVWDSLLFVFCTRHEELTAVVSYTAADIPVLHSLSRFTEVYEDIRHIFPAGKLLSDIAFPNTASALNHITTHHIFVQFIPDIL